MRFDGLTSRWIAPCKLLENPGERVSVLGEAEKVLDFVSDLGIGAVRLEKRSTLLNRQTQREIKGLLDLDPEVTSHGALPSKC